MAKCTGCGNEVDKNCDSCGDCQGCCSCNPE